MTKKNPKTRFQRIKAEAGERRCLVNGQPALRENLIRFVRSPDGVVYPDLADKLDGRGVWITNNKSVLQTALKKQLFSNKGFGKGTKVPPDLEQLVENGLRKRALDLIGLANKAGVVVTGFEKIKETAQKDQVDLLIEASDGSQAEEARLQTFMPDAEVLTPFTKEELGCETGREFCVHLGVKKSKMAENLKKEVMRLVAFLDEGQKND